MLTGEQHFQPKPILRFPTGLNKEMVRKSGCRGSSLLLFVAILLAIYPISSA
jgi:hypothetical protein